MSPVTTAPVAAPVPCVDASETVTDSGPVAARDRGSEGGFLVEQLCDLRLHAAGTPASEKLTPRSDICSDQGVCSGGGAVSCAPDIASAAANLLVARGLRTHCIGGCILRIGHHRHDCPRNSQERPRNT